VLLRKAVNLLNSELFRDLGLTRAEARTLIALLTRMRHTWGDLDETPEGDPFAI